MNIDDMLYEAENGKRSPILDRITEEAEPFWSGCEERVNKTICCFKIIERTVWYQNK